MSRRQTRPGVPGALHELGLAAAARAVRNSEVSSETYASGLLERARAHADLNAFITIDEASVLHAARQADRSVRAGRSAPLLGVPLAIKDSDGASHLIQSRWMLAAQALFAAVACWACAQMCDRLPRVHTASQ